MKIREDFQLKNIGDTYLVTKRVKEKTKILFALNETGAFLWSELLAGAEEEKLVKKLCAEYEALPEEVEMIREDVADFLEQLRGVDAVEE